MINPVHVEYKKSRYPTRNCHDGRGRKKRRDGRKQTGINSDMGWRGEREISWQLAINRKTDYKYTTPGILLAI